MAALGPDEPPLPGPDHPNRRTAIRPLVRGTRERHWNQATGDRLADGLTARQAEVLTEVIQHGSIRDAAACLVISEQTVKNHLSSINQRLRSRSTLQSAFLLGWVRFPSGYGHT